MNSKSTLRPGALSSRPAFGAPCWVSLTTRDLAAAESFYGAVLGWEWRPAPLVDRLRIARVDGVPVAGIAAPDPSWHLATAWTTYFAVSSADEAVARAQERGGTRAVGPIAFPPGRAALLADRDGATFGIWEGELFADWEKWRRAAPTFVRLRTRDAFDAAIFYGEVLQWASARNGCCEVTYEGAEVVLRSEGEVVARIHSGAVEAAPDPTVRPHWRVHFAVADVDACIDATQAHGGTVLQAGPAEAVLSDPDGARFTVTRLARAEPDA